MAPFAITVAILSLAVSSVTAWLTLFRRGTVRMTQPTVIFFGPEPSQAARHLSGGIFEVRAGGERVIYRVLFAREGSRSQVLLSLVAFNKKTQKTPPAEIRLAQRRLRDWRSRRRKA